MIPIKIIELWTKHRTRLTIATVLSILIPTTLSLEAKLLPLSLAELIGVAWLAKIIPTLLISAIGLSMILLSYIHSLRKQIESRPDFSKYIHSPEEQCWLNPSDPNDRICPTCKLEHVLSPLSKSNSRWRCAKKEHGLFGKELPPASASSEAMPTRKGFGLTHRNNNL